MHSYFNSGIGGQQSQVYRFGQHLLPSDSAVAVAHGGNDANPNFLPPGYSAPSPDYVDSMNRTQEASDDRRRRTRNFENSVRRHNGLAPLPDGSEGQTLIVGGGRGGAIAVPGNANVVGAGGAAAAIYAPPTPRTAPQAGMSAPSLPPGIAAPQRPRYDAKGWKQKLGSLKEIRDAYPKDTPEYEQAHQTYVSALQENRQLLEASQSPAPQQAAPLMPSMTMPVTAANAPGVAAPQAPRNPAPSIGHPIIDPVSGRLLGHADRAPEMTPNTSAPPIVTPGGRMPLSMLGPNSGGGSEVTAPNRQATPGDSIPLPATVAPGAQSYGMQLMPSAFARDNQIEDVSVGAPLVPDEPVGDLGVSVGGPPAPSMAPPVQPPADAAPAPQAAVPVATAETATPATQPTTRSATLGYTPAREKQWKTYIGSLQNQVTAEDSTTPAKYVAADEKTGAPGHWLKTSPKLDELKQKHADALRQWAEEKQGLRKRGETGPLGQQSQQPTAQAAQSPAPKVDPALITEENIQHTAKVNGITPEEVRRRLGV